MTTRFIGKNLGKRVVRPMKNSAKYANYSRSTALKDKVIAIAEKVNEETVANEEVVMKAPKKENKKQKKNKEMINESKLAQMEAIAGTDLPKASVKIEKADKGLYERTENSTILLTEDNKMLLND